MSNPLEIHMGPPPSAAGSGRGNRRGGGMYEWIRQAVTDCEPYIWYHVRIDANGDIEQAKKKAEALRSAISTGSNAYSMTQLRAAGWKTQTGKRVRSDQDLQIPAGQCWLYWRKVRADE